MKFINLQVAACVLLLSSLGAHADEISPYVYQRSLGAPLTSIRQWDGLYLGINAAQTWQTTALWGRPVGKSLFFTGEEGKFKQSFLSGGAFIGYNIGIASGFKLGIESDFNVSSASAGGVHFYTLDEAGENVGQAVEIVAKSADEKDAMHLRWAGATRLRFGLPKGLAMPYIAGGLVYANATYAQAGADVARAKQFAFTGAQAAHLQDSYADNTQNLFGYTIGGGVDYALNPQALIRLEYRYNDYRSQALPAINGQRVELDYKNQELRVGVAYKF